MVDNCEKTKFKDQTFDIIWYWNTSSFKHKKLSEEINRILKPGGKFLFIEPLGTNPLINFYRKLK